jgi:hypothetical protein
MAYFEQTNIANVAGTQINPATQETLSSIDSKTTTPLSVSPPNNSAGSVVRTAAGSIDDQIILFRRMLKILESQSSTDIANRQRVTVDAITAGLTLATVSAVTAITNALPAGTNTIGSVLAAGADQRQFIDVARTNYNTGIRSKLTFS